MTTLELSAVDTYIPQILKADSTFNGFGMTGYFADVPPNNQATPYVLWTYYAALDDSEVAGVRIMTEAVYLVFIVDRVRSWVNIGTQAGRLNDLLHRSTGPAGSRFMRGCIREAPS